MKNGAPRDELRNARGRGWAVAYGRRGWSELFSRIILGKSWSA